MSVKKQMLTCDEMRKKFLGRGSRRKQGKQLPPVKGKEKVGQLGRRSLLLQHSSNKISARLMGRPQVKVALWDGSASVPSCGSD